MRCVGAEIEGHIAVAELDGFARDIHRLDIFRTAAQGCEREASGVAEAVEHPVACSETLDEGPVLALVDEEARLLPFVEIDQQAVAALAYLPVVGDGLCLEDETVGGILSCGIVGFFRFREGGAALVEDSHKAFAEQVAEDIDKEREEAVHTCRMGLQHHDAVIPVGHQARKAVAFGMHQAESVGQGH